MNKTNEDLISKENKHILYFDILNIISIIAVIALHCNGIVHSNPNIRAWNTSLVIECIFYWAVPVFIMLTGANLMEYRNRYDTKTFFKKRILKVLIPFIFWAIVMVIFKLCTKQLTVESINSVKKFINVIFQNKEESTYYFMFLILGIYMTMPFLSLAAKKENIKQLWLTVILYFIFNATILNILPIFGIMYNSTLTIQIGWGIIYVILGYLLKYDNLSRKKRIIIYIVAILGLLYRFLTTFFLSKDAGKVIDVTSGYSQFHCILLAISVFLIIKNLKIIKKIEEKEKITKILLKISSCSFGIYLIHLIVKYCELKFFCIDIYSWHFRTLGIISTYLISLLIIYVIKKIPLIKKIVP